MIHQLDKQKKYPKIGYSQIIVLAPIYWISQILSDIQTSDFNTTVDLQLHYDYRIQKYPKIGIRAFLDW